MDYRIGIFNLEEKILFKNRLKAYFAILRRMLIETLEKKINSNRAYNMRNLGYLSFLLILYLSWGLQGNKYIVALFKTSSENIHLNLKDHRASGNQQEKVLHSTKPSDKIT